MTKSSWVLSNKSAAAQTQRLKSTIGTVFRTSVNWCFVAKAHWNKVTVKQPVRFPPDSTNTTNPLELKLYFQEHNALKAIVLGKKTSWVNCSRRCSSGLSAGLSTSPSVLHLFEFVSSKLKILCNCAWHNHWWKRYPAHFRYWKEKITCRQPKVEIHRIYKKASRWLQDFFFLALKILSPMQRHHWHFWTPFNSLFSS